MVWGFVGESLVGVVEEVDFRPVNTSQIDILKGKERTETLVGVGTGGVVEVDDGVKNLKNYFRRKRTGRHRQPRDIKQNFWILFPIFNLLRQDHRGSR